MSDIRQFPAPAPPGPGARRSQGQTVVARALWYVKPGQAELRTERLSPPRPGEIRVETRYSAISRGTERLVALGQVPEGEYARMRAPLQTGDFPFPVKYGYSAVGTVIAGTEALVGRTVFCLHPHQDFFQAADAFAVTVPDTIPARRATLAANMETALNAHWDAGTAPGDSVLVVGAGIVGLLTAYLAQRIPGTRVAITDIDPGRAAVASALGLKFVSAADAPGDQRLVFHASATSAGLETAISKAGFEARIVELSWYGANPVTINLGGAFHSRRLTLQASQVGHVAPNQRALLRHRDRLERAVALLDDAALDALVGEEIAFCDLASTLPRLWVAQGGLPPVVRYQDGS